MAPLFSLSNFNFFNSGKCKKNIENIFNYLLIYLIFWKILFFQNGNISMTGNIENIMMEILLRRQAFYLMLGNNSPFTSRDTEKGARCSLGPSARVLRAPFQ